VRFTHIHHRAGLIKYPQYENKTSKVQVELGHFSHLSFFLQWWNRTPSISRMPEIVEQGIINSYVLSALAF
jgi:hypothetical protein